MELTPTGLALLGLLMAAWTIAAAWSILAAREHVRQGNAARRTVRRLSRMIDGSPAVPMIVRADGRIEAPERLAAWLGLDAVPSFLSELQSRSGGLVDADLAELQQAVMRTQKTAASFTMVVTPRDSSKSLGLRGQLADPAVAPAGAALVWFFSEDEGQLSRLRAEVARTRGQLAVLSGLVDAAPIPIWLRGPDSRMQLANNAYLEAVGTADADPVAAREAELAGLSGFRISEVPIAGQGLANYAIDMGEVEEQARAFDALQRAQRSALERLSLGVAQFDADRALVFANASFRRDFGLPSEGEGGAPGFDRFLEIAREGGHLPKGPDVERWRRNLAEWFGAENAGEDFWRQADGTELRVIGQPMPDGGLLLLVEERARQHSSARDTLLRNRAAIFDNLSESLAVFAQNGKVLLWNRRFPTVWGLPEQAFEDRPRVDALLDRIGPQLSRSDERGLISEVIRAASLGREPREERLSLADGRILEVSGVPLPDGSALLRVLEVAGLGENEDETPDASAALDKTEVELMPFVTQVVRKREKAVEARRLTVDLRGDRKAGAVLADKDQLGNALGALIDDAIAVTPERGRILITLSRRKSAARILISDGGGEREPNAAARQIVEAHGGTIEVTSGGSRASMIVSLP